MHLISKILLIQIIFIAYAVANNTPLEKVSLQLHWKQQFEFAGYFIAKEKGFFKDVGIDVDILEYHNEDKKFSNDEIICKLCGLQNYIFEHRKKAVMIPD